MNQLLQDRICLAFFLLALAPYRPITYIRLQLVHLLITTSLLLAIPIFVAAFLLVLLL